MNISFTGGRVFRNHLRTAMALSVGKLNKFLGLDETFGDVQDIETAYQVLHEFETLTRQDFQVVHFILRILENSKFKVR